MTISDKKYQVFISSTYTDLKEERAKVTDVIGNEKYIIFGKMEYIRISNNDASFSVTMVHRFR